jgi:hypothetical protein
MSLAAIVTTVQARRCDDGPMRKMTILAASILGLAATGAHADDVPSRVKPFLKSDEMVVKTAEASLGAGTAILAFTCRDGEAFDGFAVVPVKGKDQRVTLAKLPMDPIQCEMKVLLVANVDKDPAEEVVATFWVLSNGVKAWDNVVLHWNGKAFVRVPALERKLDAKAGPKEPLSEDDVRAALGIKKH